MLCVSLELQPCPIAYFQPCPWLSRAIQMSATWTGDCPLPRQTEIWSSKIHLERFSFFFLMKLKPQACSDFLPQLLWSRPTWQWPIFRADEFLTCGSFLNHEIFEHKLIFSSHFDFMQHEEMVQPPLWNGVKRPCFLAARKFQPETLDKLLHLFSNYTLSNWA